MGTDTRILSRLVKNLKSKQSDPLRPLLDEYFMKRDRSPNRLQKYFISIPDRPRPGGRLSPSSIGGCMRLTAFKFLGIRGRQRRDPDLIAKFDDGNWRHWRWGALFLDMQEVLGSDRFRVLSLERPVSIDKLWIAGTPDAEIEIENFGPLVVDFKGINDAGFTYVVTHDEPKVEHVRQIHTYMRATNKRKGLILYENKNNQLTRSCMIEFDQVVWSEVRGWCRDVVEYLESRELPPMHPECQAGNFLWEKCPYSSLCYGTMTTSEVTRKAYRNFTGVEEAWRKSNSE